MEKESKELSIEEFGDKVFGDFAGAMTISLCAIGDKLGLFKDLAKNGPSNSQELAERTGINERYAREWLAALGCAEYLKYSPNTQKFSLPKNHEAVIATEMGPGFIGGMFQEMLGLSGVMDEIIKVFKEGGGVHQSQYSDDWWTGMERETGPFFEHVLVQDLIPLTPSIQTKLNSGVNVADIGSGHGRAMVNLAKAFPNSRYVGYDIHEPSVMRANQLAENEGVADRVSFDVLDGASELPEKYDVITTFDVVHDSANPLGLLKSIRNSLKPDGIYLMLEIHSENNYEDNIGTVGAALYGWSVLYCMTTSLANGGEGLGTLGLPEKTVREYCNQTNFSKVTKIPLDDPFHAIYEINR